MRRSPKPFVAFRARVRLSKKNQYTVGDGSPPARPHPWRSSPLLRPLPLWCMLRRRSIGFVVDRVAQAPGSRCLIVDLLWPAMCSSVSRRRKEKVRKIRGWVRAKVGRGLCLVDCVGLVVQETRMCDRCHARGKTRPTERTWTRFGRPLRRSSSFLCFGSATTALPVARRCPPPSSCR